MNNDFVKGLWGKAVEGDDGVFNGDGLPFTSRDRIADGYIVDVHVIISTTCCGFAIEGDFNGLAQIGRKINVYVFARGSDIVIDIAGTAVVPLP